MTISQIKSQLNIVSLDLGYSLDEEKKPTQWLRYWNNDDRFAVVIHQDVVGKIKADPTINTLALKHETKYTKTGDSKGIAYDSYIVITATSIVAVL